MRRLRDICPHWTTLETRPLLEQAGFNVLSALIMKIADWYKLNLPLWAVLQHFGYNGLSDGPGRPRYPLIGPYTDKAQVSCQLPSHGGEDVAPSARYYLEDRNENSHFGHIFCFASNCQKAYTSFWYLYVMLKFHRDFKYNDVICYIEEHFGVAFPRHILLDADFDNLDADEEREAKASDIAQRFIQARLLREQLKTSDRMAFLAAMAELYNPSIPNPEVNHG